MAPGLALRHLLIGACVWFGYDPEPLTVIDIQPAADPADDLALVLSFGSFAGEEELHAMTVRELLRPDSKGRRPRVEPSDAAWAEYRARQFKARLMIESDRVSQI